MGGSLATLPVRSSRTRYSLSGKNFSMKSHRDISSKSLNSQIQQRKESHPVQLLFQQAV